MKIGKAAELRVASELLLKGFNPSLMLEISEADIILTNGIKIQVKSAHINNIGRYCFNFKSWKKEINGKRKFKKHDLKNIDFVILWAIEDNMFFIFSAEEVKRINSYSLGFMPNPQQRKISNYGHDWFMQHKDKWDLLNL